MEENWASYFTVVNDKPTSILLDLNAGTPEQQTQRPYLCNVYLTCSAPTEDGWPTDEENDQLNQLEDQIADVLAQTNDGQQVGRCTSNGQRILFFYLAQETGLEAALAQCFAENAAYDCEYAVTEDKSWSSYFEFLAPSEEERQTIENQSVLQVLQREGDNLTAVRRIDHWLYFPSPETRAKGAEAVVKLGYLIQGDETPTESEQAPTEGEQTPSWRLQIYRDDSVEPATIDAATIELFRLAQEHGGAYDGWETFVVRQ